MPLLPLLAGWLACSAPESEPPPAPAPAPSEGPAVAAEVEPTEERYAASHVLVAFTGAARAPATVSRSEEEARALAFEIFEQVSGGADLSDLAREHSDGPEAVRGGAIGVYRTGTMMPAFERAVAAVDVGAVTRPFRTPLGWHVARRDAVVEARARHILVPWKGAWRSEATRDKQQARELIEAARARLDAGEDFAAVAREVGEDATAQVGGDLGLVAPGQLVPSFEEALFALEPGERSDVVETPYGFHLIERAR